MVQPGDDIETRFGAMNLRRIIPTDMTASALAHLLLLALVFLFSEVNPFGAVTAEPIAVDIVSPQEIAEQVVTEKAEVEKAPEPFSIPPPPRPALDTTNAASAPAPAAKPAAPARPQKQAALSAARAYAPPEPDVTVKYNVLLGLPPDMVAAPPPSGDKKGDNFDVAATQAADVASSVIADF